MSLYKNMFRFILDDTITGKVPLKEHNSLYRAFFEGILEEDMPPASDFGFKAIPYTSPTEYVELGKEGVPGARRFKRDISRPDHFTAIGRGGRRPTPEKYYTEPDNTNVPQTQQGIEAPPQQGIEAPPQQGMEVPQNQPPSGMSTQDTSIRPTLDRPITMHPGDVFSGEVSGMSADDVKMLKDGSIQIGYLNIKREEGVPIYSNDPDIATKPNDIQNCAVYRKKKKEALESGSSEKKADAVAELYTQNIMVANRLVDMVHRLWDEKTKTLKAHVKPIGTGKISLTNMAGSMVEMVRSVSMKNGHANGNAAYKEYSEKFNKFVTLEMTPENIDSFIESSWEDISVLMSNANGILNPGAISSYYESLDCIIKAGTAKSEGFLLIPFRKNEQGVDSISIFSHTTSINGFRANAVEFLPSQVKYKSGASADVDDKLYSTVYQGLYEISQNRVRSGLEAFGDIQKLRSPEVLGDLMVIPTRTINGKKVVITDRESIVNIMTSRADKAEEELAKIFNNNTTAILLSLGRDEDHQLTEEQILEMHKDPIKLQETLRGIKYALSKNRRNNIGFMTNSEGRVIKVTGIDNIDPVTGIEKIDPHAKNYGKASFGNEKYTPLTERVWGAWILGNELLCSIANEHAHSQGITLAKYSKVSLTYSDGGLDEQELEVLDKETGKKKKIPGGVGLVYHNQDITQTKENNKNAPFMFTHWPTKPKINTASAPRKRLLARFVDQAKQYITSVYQYYHGRLIRG